MVAAPGLGAAWHYSPLNFKLAVKPIGLTLYSSTAFLVTGGEFGVVFIAGARGVVNVI